jgi:hypothetical protein
VNKRALVPKIERALAALGKELSVVVRRRPPKAATHASDLIVELKHQRGPPVRLVIEVSANPRAAPIQKAAAQAWEAANRLGGIPVVASARLGSGVRQWLRQEGIGYLDLHGHVLVRGAGIIIDRDHGPPSAPAGPEPTAGSGSPFADRSSLVVRHLLSGAPVQAGVRGLAAELGISPALVSRVLNRLRQDGYLESEPADVIELTSVEPLLDEWSEYYRRRARRQREKRFYLHARDTSAVLELLPKKLPARAAPQWALSFQAGASLIAPFAFFSEVHLLIGGPDWDQAAERVEHNLGAEPAEKEANMVLVEPYYRESWDHGLREVSKLPVVSDIQLFLDLSVYPRRGAEQATRIREHIVRRFRRGEGV